MADTSGMAEIRGIDIDKLAKGYADEEYVFKGFCSQVPTSAREIRWYKRTAGTLSATSPAVIANVSDGAQPFILEQSWTRQVSYVRKYFVESPILSNEDIKDSDIDILAGNVRDLTKAIAYQVDTRIWNVATENQAPTNINTFSIGLTKAWNLSGAATDIVGDLLHAKRLIKEYNYNPEGAILYLSPLDYQNVMTWIISTKGSSFPQFSSENIRNGVVMNLVGLRVVVSNSVTTSGALVIIPNRAITWKSFAPITARTIEDVGIGTKIRVWEEGEAILTDPKAVCYITGTQI